MAGPVGESWSDLREVIRPLFRDVARVSNWMVRELAKAEPVRKATDKKLAKAPTLYLYPGARKACPDLDPQTVSAIEQAVKGRYRAKRFDAIWRCAESLPNYRLGRSVYPVHNQSWRAEIGEGGEALVNLRLGGARRVLRLRGGGQFRRQLRDHRLLVSGEAVRGEFALYEQGGSGAHRPGTVGRDAGGQRSKRRLMAKMVGWFPREPAAEGHGTLFVTRSPDALVVALNEKDNRLWTYHGDHIQRWESEHAVRTQKLSDDRKAGLGKRMRSRQEAEAQKYRRRMDSACHEISAHIVGYAKRRRFASICWVPGETTRTFQWHKLTTYLEYKAGSAGLGYEAMKEVNDGAREAQAV